MKKYEVDELIKVILVIALLILFGYAIGTILCKMKMNNMKIGTNGITQEVNPRYPDTDNPIMEGVTSKTYTAVRKDGM